MSTSAGPDEPCVVAPSQFDGGLVGCAIGLKSGHERIKVRAPDAEFVVR
jgi:hypothetical protein